MSVPTQDPPRVIDERPRYYRMTTPRGVTVTVGLAGAAGEGTLKIERPIDTSLGMNTAPTFHLDITELWALWACLTDGLGVAGDSPDWANAPLDPLDAAGNPLPPLPGARPF